VIPTGKGDPCHERQVSEAAFGLAAAAVGTTGAMMLMVRLKQAFDGAQPATENKFPV
jgi:hypothetical protein